MGEAWTYVTPDAKKAKRNRKMPSATDNTAIRAAYFREQTRNQHEPRPRAPPPPPPSKVRSFLLLTPWSSIVSWAFLVTGLVTYIINAPKLADITVTLMDNVEYASSLPYVSHLYKAISSYIISGTLGLVSILVGAIAAYIHIKHVVNGPFWTTLHRTFLTSTLLIGLLYLVACIAWFVILMNYVSSWMTALWTFEQGATVQAQVLASNATLASSDVCVDACLNLAQYPFFGTDGCVCDATSASGLATVAHQARGKGMWVLVGVAAICVGLIHSAVNVAADMGGTWVVINAEIVNVLYNNKDQEAGDEEGDEDDDAVSGISSAINTTPATHTKEYVKSRLGVGGIGTLGTLGSVPGHLAAPSQLQHASGVFSSNV